MVFYRKYRPKTLAELDNREVAHLIGKYLTSDSVPHAFLFIGPKGTGKTSTARILAKSLNCLTGKGKKIACGTCAVCGSIARGDNLDVLEIDAASNRGIDEIRELREKIKLMPIALAYKVYIIDEVHMLTTEAFNALLKTLEEPPLHAVFVLATTEPHKIPDTILSRSVRVNFHKASPSELLHALKRIVSEEKLTIKEEVLVEIAASADGSFRDGAKLLEELVLEHKNPSLSDAQEKLGVSDSVQIEQCLIKLQKKDAAGLLTLMKTLENEGKNVRHFFLTVLTRLEKLLVDSYGKPAEWQQKDLVRLIRLLSHAFSEVKNAVVPQLPFELAIVEYCEEVSASVPPALQKIAESVAPVLTATISQDESVLPLTEKWDMYLELLKSYNHSIAGVLRSCRPLTLKAGVLTLEAGYKFHAERLTEPKVRDILAKTVKDVIGLDVKIEVVIKKR